MNHGRDPKYYLRPVNGKSTPPPPPRPPRRRGWKGYGTNLVWALVAVAVGMLTLFS